MSFPFRLRGIQSKFIGQWLNGNGVLLGELVGINENAIFRILRTIAESAYTRWKQLGKSYFEGIQIQSAQIKTE
jgi:hypothetical protein